MPARSAPPERPIAIPAVPVAERSGDSAAGVEPPTALHVPEPLAATEPTAARQRRTSAAPAAAWVASLVLLVALASAAYSWRSSIMAAWPPSERLYAALGLTTKAEGGQGR